jgi:hypothetical protein
MHSITSDDVRNVLIGLVVAAITFAFGVLYGSSSRMAKSWLTRFRINSANRKSFGSRSLLVVSGSRFELTPSQLKLTLSKEYYRIRFPRTYRRAILEAAPDFAFHAPGITRRVEALLEETRSMFPDIDTIIDSSRNRIAQAFVRRSERLERLFNGKLYHPLRMSSAAVVDERESPTVSVDFFETDYFTHQVILDAFTQIRDRPEVRNALDKGHVPPALRFFLNGFGLNCMVCAFPQAKSRSSAALVLGRRSGRVGKTSYSGMWTVTANEALSETDVEDQVLSARRWIKRALHEEVGIREYEILHIFVFNVVIALKDMQPGMLCLAICDVEPSMLESRIAGSQDGNIEFDAHQLIPFNDEAIAKVLRADGLELNGNGPSIPLSPSADNILRNIIARGCESFR